MSVQDRIEALREKHASLERALDEEIHRPLPNQDDGARSEAPEAPHQGRDFRAGAAVSRAKTARA